MALPGDWNSSKVSLLAVATVLVLVAAGASPSGAEPLSSWTDGAAKQRIVAFVEAVTRESGPSYVAPEDRVAVFDNDGTLWVEKPTYTQVYFLLDRLQALAPEHPEWKTQQPFQAVLENDREAFLAAGDHAVVGQFEVP